MSLETEMLGREEYKETVLDKMLSDGYNYTNHNFGYLKIYKKITKDLYFYNLYDPVKDKVRMSYKVERIKRVI